MKTRASVRLRGEPVQATLDLEIPQFRYVNDVQRFLDQLQSRLTDLTEVVRAQQVALASLKRKPDLEARASAAEINKAVAPGIRKLKSQYGLLQDLYDLHRTVEGVESQFGLQFDERSGAAYTGVQKSLKTLKADLGQQMKTVFSFLSDVADRHVPSKFRTYLNSVVSAVEHQVPEAQVQKTFLYASTCPQGNLVFTFYLYLVGAGHHMYVSVQQIIGGATYVQVGPEFMTPDELFEIGPGQEVGSANEAVKIALQLLNAEGLKTENARGPQPNKSYEGQEGAQSFLTTALTFLGE